MSRKSVIFFAAAGSVIVLVLSVIFYGPYQKKGDYRGGAHEPLVAVPVSADAGSGWKYRFKIGKGVRPVGSAPIAASEIASSDEFGRANAALVKKAFQHAWRAYRARAWGRDEVKPLSGAATDAWGGLGCTLVDSLDALWLMGLRDEFREAAAWVAADLHFNQTSGHVSVFEATIRVLGGLLGAFDLSGDLALLAKAEDLGRRLLPAFDASPSAVPYSQVDLTGREPPRNSHWSPTAGVLAEMGTLQLEFGYLSAMTGDPRFTTAAGGVGAHSLFDFLLFVIP